MKLDLKELIRKLIEPTTGTYITPIGDIQYVKQGNIIMINLKGIANGITANTVIPQLPTPKNNNYIMLELSYSTVGIAYIEYYNNTWTFHRRSGSSPVYGCLTYITD